jgi:hypothetical protein
MDDRILYNPDNRFLASSGSNDFSLYGAPSDPALSFAPVASPAAPADATPSAPAAGAPADAASDPANPEVPASDSTSAPPDAAEAAAGSAPNLPPISFVEAAPTAAAVATPLAPFTGGFTAPPAVDRAEVAPPPQPAASPAAAADTVPAFASAPAGPVPAGTVDDIAASVAVGTLPPGLQEVIGPATTGPLSDVLVAAPAALDDGVTDLLGSDPAGGIATLISLVTISEVLDLQPVTTAGEDAILASAPPVIDALAADALGETAPADAGPEDAVETLITVPMPGDDDLPGGLG